MFERLVIGRSADTTTKRLANRSGSYMPYALGDLAEAVVFYDRVYVVGNRQDLASLVWSIGPEPFYRLCESGNLRVRFNTGSRSYGGDDTTLIFPLFEPKYNRTKHLETVESFEESLISLGADRLMAGGIARFLADDDGTWNGDTELDSRNEATTKLIAQAEAKPAFLSGIAHEFLSFDNPTMQLPEHIVHLDEGGYFRMPRHLSTYTSIVTDGGEMITPAGSTSAYFRLMDILDQLALGIAVNAEFACDVGVSAALSHILRNAIQRSGLDQQILRFQDRRFGNGRAIASVIESRQRTFDDLLDLIHKKPKFSAWLGDQPLEADVFHDFWDNLGKDSWVERLPAKGFRWVLCGLIELIGGPIIGRLAGAFNELLLSRLVEKWNPHQFINEPLARFVKPAEERT